MPTRVNSWGSNNGKFGPCKTCPDKSNFDWQWDLKDKAGHCAISLDPWTGDIRSHDRQWCEKDALPHEYCKFEPKKKQVTVYLDSQTREPTPKRLSEEDAMCGNREVITLFVDRLPLGFKSKLQRKITNKYPCVYVRRPSQQAL